ncbi:uncharacterized protein LOC119391698 [Rhipicephalus sanguineus]|uniref:uncharacterized protein LOC119391698 n=1 Tax=Rhipicephalus sanguineus TaxID=34632 RepID=UPI001894FCAC|nr:uncharacterized protein LOC119391698 [Rhipicephalus sanguineus]
MAFLIPVLVVLVVSLSVQTDAQENDIINVLEAVMAFDEAVAIYSTINDPNQKCLKTERDSLDYEAKTANFTWYYQGGGDSPTTKCFYNLMNGTDPAVFYIASCDDTSNLEEAKELYSDGATCFVGHFPPVTGDQCMLWVHPASKDAIPPKCEEKFDEKCGGEKYELYDESSCQ